MVLTRHRTPSHRAALLWGARGVAAASHSSRIERTGGNNTVIRAAAAGGADGVACIEEEDSSSQKLELDGPGGGQSDEVTVGQGRDNGGLFFYATQ